MKNIFNKNLLSIAILSVAVIAFPALAKGAIVTNTNPTELNDFVQLAVNVSNWILGIVGSLALLMFVIGGFMFLISAGNSKTVEQGKSIIIGSVIGLLLVFSSYMIIQFSMSAMGLEWSGNTSMPTPISPVTQVYPNDCIQLYGPQGYSCMTATAGNSCISNHCGPEEGIKCCLPN